MLRIETNRGLSAFQNVAQQEFQQIAFALPAIAQNEDAGGGFVLGAAVQVHNDVGAVAVPADIETVRVIFAGVVEGEQICHTGGGEDPFEQGVEDIAACRIGREKAIPLAQETAVGVELGTGEFRQNIVPQGAQTVRVLCGEFNEDGAVDQRLPWPSAASLSGSFA